METGMIFRRIVLGYLFVIILVPGFSQADSLVIGDKTSSNLRFAYNSSIIYPGIRVGVEIPVNTINMLKKTKNNGTKTILKERYVSFNSGWYHHPDFHDNLYFTAEWTMRRKYAGKLFKDISIGTGYSRTFLGGTTYTVDNYGNVRIVKAAGYNYAMIVAGAGFGFDFSEVEKYTLSVFSRFNILTMFPYNSTIYFRPVFELGLIYRPEKFLQVRRKRSEI
jgi:hypothetical protein